MRGEREDVTASAPQPLSVRANLIWNTLGALFYQGCLWLITVLVVVLSKGYDNSGALAYGMALGNILYTIATYNMRSVQVSDAEDRFSAREYIGFRVVTVCVAVLSMSIYTILTTSSPTLLVAALCFFLFKVDESFCSVYYAIEQKSERMDFIGISQALRGVIILLAFSLSLVLTNNINIAVIAMSIGCMTVTLLFDARHASLFGSIAPLVSTSTVLTMFRRYLPAFIALLCYGSVVSLARQIFGNLYGGDSLGVYAAVATPTVIVQLAASFLTAPFVVGLARARADRDRRALVRGLLTIIGGLLIVFVILVMLAALFGEAALVKLYGPSIAESAHLLVPVIIATSEVAFAAVFLDVLVVMGQLRGLMISNLIAVAVCLIVSEPFMASFSMAGINWTIMVSFGIALLIDAILFAWSVSRL